MAGFPWQGMAGMLAIAALAGCAGDGSPMAGDAAAPAWPDSRWTVVAMADADGRLADVPAGVAIDLGFDATASRVAGSAGCNRYSATATVDGTTVAFGPAAASKRLCGAPEGLMALEARFLRALAQVAGAAFEGARLELRAADGTPLLALARAPAD